MSSDCVFCKISAGILPAKFIYSNDFVFVIEDIHPRAPIHYLIIPKRHIEKMEDLHREDENGDYAAAMFEAVAAIADSLPGDRSYKLVVNNGRGAGQEVMHLHWHLLAGKKVSHDVV